MASMLLLASSAGQGSVTSSARASSPGWRRSISPMTMRAMRAATRWRSPGASGAPSASSMPRAWAICSAGSLEGGGPPVSPFDDHPPPHRNGAGGQDAAVLDQREFGRAAADVDIEQCRVVTARERDGARSMGCHLAFHVVAGRGADEFAGFLGEEIRDGACVAALERLAGQNDGAAVDLLAFDAGIGVAAADGA